MRKKYTIHKKRKYTKKNKIKKSKNKIKYTKKKYKKKIKTKRKQGGARYYDTIDNPDELRDIIREIEAELDEKDEVLEEQYNELQRAAKLGKGLLAANERLKEKLTEAGIDSENLSLDLKETKYRKQELDSQTTVLDADITTRQEALERERIEIEELRQKLETEIRGIENYRERKKVLETENARLQGENRVIGTNNIQLAETNGKLSAKNKELVDELNAIKQKIDDEENYRLIKTRFKRDCLKQIGEELDPIISDLEDIQKK